MGFNKINKKESTNNNEFKVETVKDIIMNRLDLYGKKTAIMDKDLETDKFINYSYSTLKEDTLALGTAFNEILNLEDEKVAVLGDNSYKWLITYLSVVSGVGVIVPLDRELPSNEVLGLIKRSKVKAIVYSNKKKEIIDEIRNKVDKNIKFINMDKYKHDEIEYSLNELVIEGKKLIKEGNTSYIDKKIDKDKFAILLFTSGTTANSKGVMLSNYNVTSNAVTVNKIYSQITSTVAISFLPMHHSYEMTMTYITGLYGGATIGISRGIRYLLKDFEIIKPQTFCMVPLILENLKKKIEKSIRMQNKEKTVQIAKSVTDVLKLVNVDIKRDVFKTIHNTFGGRLKYLVIAGAPADKETIDKMQGYGFTVIEGYGLTETSPLVCGNREGKNRPGTVGIAIDDVKVRIDLKADEKENTGEIIVKGPNVMLGYYEDEEETKKVLKKGWFYTGDIGYFDNKGSLVISGRSKNVIVTSNGKNIYPEEIESLINRIPLVNECIVYGDGDNRDLEVKVKIALDEEYIKEKYGDDIPSNDELYKSLWSSIKKINSKLVHYKAVKDITIVTEGFEKTTTMKIKRNKVK